MTNPAHVDDHAFIRSLNKEIDETPELANVAEFWQQIVGMVREAAVRSHRLATMIMHDYQATKRPFALYLRSFESEAYQYVDQPGPSGDPTTMWTTQHGATDFEIKFAAAIAGRLPLLGIANPTDLTTRAEIPRLQLPNDGWQRIARNLIEHAAFIVMECEALAPGVIWELDTICSAGRQDATVIVFPAKNSDRGGASLGRMARLLGAVVKERELPSGDDPRLAPFRRIAGEDEIDFDRIEDSLQFGGLLSPAIAAAAAAPPFDPMTYATHLNNQGVKHFNDKDYHAAMNAYDQALLVRRSINDRSGLLTTLMNIGSAFIDGGQPEDSLAFLTEAYEIARELGRTEDQGMVAAYLGVAAKLRDDMSEAIRWFSEAVPIFEAASPANLKDALVHLAMAHDRMGDRENAIACALRLQQLGAL